MSCPAFTIGQVNQPLYDKLLAGAVAAGAKVEGTTVTYKKCVFNFDFDAGHAQLVVTCLTHPFEYGCNTIRQHILDLVNKLEGVS